MEIPLEEREKGLVEVDLSDDGMLLAVARDDIEIWDTVDRKIWKRIEFETRVISLTFVDNNRSILVSSGSRLSLV